MSTVINSDISQSELEDAAQDHAGNWQKFECFIWDNIPEDAEDYCIVYTENRDSGVINRANSEAIRRVMKKCKCAHEETHNHWAVGWVKGWVIRVFDKRGRITTAFKRYYELKSSMEDYPLLDEELFSEFELEEQEEAWENVVKDEFQREVEKRFPEYDFDFSDRAGEEDGVEEEESEGARKISVHGYFDNLADTANECWEDGYIDVKRIVATVDLAECPFLISYKVRYIDVGEVTEVFDKEQEALQRVADLRAAGFLFASYEVVDAKKEATE